MESDTTQTILATINEKLKSSPVEEVKTTGLISDLKSENVRLLTVVEALGETLVSTNKTVRERGIDFISCILSELPTNLLKDKEIVVIGKFYLENLQDHHSLLPVALKGLLALVKMDNINNESVLQIVMQLFQHVNCQTQLPNDRFFIFSIMKEVIEKHLDDCRVMGPDLVFGVISFIEGETDPKNLFLIFSIMPVFLRNFPLGHLVEEMFEVLSCYFPVDFNPVAKSNVSVTREDLALGLNNCLAATRDFAEFCLPLSLEKLDSSLKIAKLDTYKLLQTCCETYSAEDFEKHLNPVWKLIQKDVLPGNDMDICNAALKTIASLFKLLSVDESKEEILNKLLSDVFTCVKSLLCKVNDSLFEKAMNLLAACCTQSQIVTGCVFRVLKPFCEPQFTLTPFERITILQSLLPFVILGLKFNIEKSENAELLSSFNAVISLFLNSTSHNNADVRKTAFLGIQKVVNDLNEESLSRLISIVVDNVRCEADSEVRKESLKVFRDVSLTCSNEILEAIPNSLQIKTKADPGNEELSNVLNALAVIADISSFTSCTIPSFLFVILETDHYKVGLRCLLKIVESGSGEFLQVLLQKYEIVDKLITWWLEGVTKVPVDETYYDLALLKTTAEIIEVIVRHQEGEVQQTIVNNYFQIFLENEHVSNGRGGARPLACDIFSHYSQTVLLLEAVLGSVNQDVQIPSLTLLADKLSILSLKAEDTSTRTSSSRLLASLINKSEETVAIQLFDKISEQIFITLSDTTRNSNEKTRAVEFYSWIVKGMLLRGASNLPEVVKKWFHLLNTEVGFVVAEGFRLVLEEEDVYLTLKSHCNIKILYRQRLFMHFPELVKIYKSASEEVKINYILALTRLIQGVPKHVFIPELSNVIIVLLQSLSTKRTEVLLPTLDILSKLLEDKEKIFLDFVESFTPKFLELAKFDGSMKIRIKALTCLYHYGFYPTPTLLPIKQTVIRELESCLDDKKRFVRNEAVKARNRWFLVGAPGEDSIFS